MSLFAGNVSHRASPEEVRQFFSKFGPCRVDVKRGYAFIDYDDERDAQDARMDTNGKELHGMKLNVEWSKKHLARTGGGGGSVGDWGRGRRRHTDDRRSRDYDRDYDRDYGRRRYGSPSARDRGDRDRDRDYDRRHDRDRDEPRYDRGRDRDRRDRDRHDRDGDGGRVRYRDRSRERDERKHQIDDGSIRDGRRGLRMDGDKDAEDAPLRRDEGDGRGEGRIDEKKSSLERDLVDNGKGLPEADGNSSGKNGDIDEWKGGKRKADVDRYDDRDRRRRRDDDDADDDESYKRRRTDDNGIYGRQDRDSEDSRDQGERIRDLERADHVGGIVMDTGMARGDVNGTGQFDSDGKAVTMDRGFNVGVEVRGEDYVRGEVNTEDSRTEATGNVLESDGTGVDTMEAGTATF